MKRNGKWEQEEQNKESVIREKMQKEAERIPVPESVHPDVIENKLREKHKHPATLWQEGKRRRRIVAAAAAVVFLIAGGVWMAAGGFSDRNAGNGNSDTGITVADAGSTDDAGGTGNGGNTGNTGNGAAENGDDQRTGTSYDNIWEAVKDYAKQNGTVIMTAEDAASGKEDVSEQSVSSLAKSSASADSTGAGSSVQYSETDLQVQGVMEGDIVKTDGRAIYTACQKNSQNGNDWVTKSVVKIYQAEGEKVEKVSAITLDDYRIDEMYLSGDKLILEGQQWQPSGTQDKENVEDISDTEDASDTEDSGDSASAGEQTGVIKDHTDSCYTDDVIWMGNCETKIIIYDISDLTSPKKAAEHTQSGFYTTSRISDGYLYTFSDYTITLKDSDKKSDREEYIPLVDGALMKERDLTASAEKGGDSYLVMTALALTDISQFKDQMAELGGANVIYMNENHIYSSRDMWWQDGGQSKSIVTRYIYKDGIFQKDAQAKTRGTLNDSYYMHEYNGYFCYVYTKYTEGDDSEAAGRSKNGIAILDENMKEVGHLGGLGKGEEIYASYYIDHMAYFVTYRNTDPVFAVDLSDVTQPKLMSELKLPGFSDYLHAFGDGNLIGIGMGETKDKRGRQAGAVKLSLFRYNKDYKLSEKDSRVIDLPYSYSTAGDDHRAVYVDEERQIVGFGVSDYDNEYYYLYQYTDGKWKELKRLDCESQITNVRGIRIGDYFYLVDVEKGIQSIRL